MAIGPIHGNHPDVSPRHTGHWTEGATHQSVVPLPVCYRVFKCTVAAPSGRRGAGAGAEAGTANSACRMEQQRAGREPSACLSY